MINKRVIDVRLEAVLPVLINLLPLASLILAMLFMFPHEKGVTAPTQAANNQAGSVMPIVALVCVLAYGGAKCVAVWATIKAWYYGWVFHAAELALVLVLLGGIAVLAPFLLNFDVLGFIKLICLFLLLAANIALKRAWFSRLVKDRYRVTFYTHS